MSIKIFYAPIAAMFLTASLVSCTNEVLNAAGEDAYLEGNNTSFSISLNNGAVSPSGTRGAELGNKGTGDVASENREAQLNKVYAVAFLNGKYYGTFEGTQPADGDIGNSDELGTTYTGTTDYRFDFHKIGSYKVYIVTNVNGTLSAVSNGGSGYNCSASTDAVKTIADFTAGTSVPADLFAAVINQTPGDGNTDENFIMTSAEQTVNIDATQIKNQGSIDVSRASARFDVYVNSSMNANVGSETSDFKMTNITFKNRYTTTLMARDDNTDKDMAITGLTKTNTSYDQTAGGTSPGTTSCTETIYGYENYNDLDATTPDALTDGVTIINVQGIYKRGENENLEVNYDIPFIDSSTGKVIPIERNHLYKVTLGRKDNTPTEFAAMSYSIEVVDWNTGETLKLASGDLKDEEVPEVTEVSYGATPTVVSDTGTAPSIEYEIPDDVTSITIKTSTASMAAAKLVTDDYQVQLYDNAGNAITDIEILEVTANRVYHENGTLTQEFTVTFPANTGAADNVEYQMHLENQFDTDFATDFKIIHLN